MGGGRSTRDRGQGTGESEGDGEVVSGDREVVNGGEKSTSVELKKHLAKS